MKNRLWLLFAIPALVAVIAGVLVGVFVLNPSPAPDASSTPSDEPASAESAAPEETSDPAPAAPAALTAGEVTVDADMLTFLTYEQYYTYALNGGVGAPPRDRLDTPRPTASDGGTWRDYFAAQAAAASAYWLALAAAAADEGMTLSDKGEQAADYRTALIAPEAYGVTADAVRRVFALRGLSYEYRAKLRSGFTCTADRLAEAVTENGYDKEENADLPSRDLRLLTLSIAEDTRDLDAQRMMDIMGIWQSGEQTEERFASLVRLYSEGDETWAEGGLYTGVCRGDMIDQLDKWLFEPFRKPGDVDVFEMNNTYYIVCFVGEGESEATARARAFLRSAWEDKQIDDLQQRWPARAAA